MTDIHSYVVGKLNTVAERPVDFIPKGQLNLDLLQAEERLISALTSVGSDDPNEKRNDLIKELEKLEPNAAEKVDAFMKGIEKLKQEYNAI